ncbi:MAG: hypothetical protein ACYDAX_03610 [Desulfobacteria bacterium]|nr:hypothetical protein [Deltaproteobacteria bacterium]
MPSLWVCVDVRTGGEIAASLGRTTLFSEEPGKPAAVAPGSAMANSADDRQERERIAGAVEEVVSRGGGPGTVSPGGVLLALPDGRFRIALATPEGRGAHRRMAEYARWKVLSDWGIPEEDALYDWQRVSPPWERRKRVLIVAAERQAVARLTVDGTIAGLPVALVLPRSLAAWNGSPAFASGNGLRGLVFEDATAFIFFGTAGGRLRYVRSRACSDLEERDAEIAETARHFAETLGVPADAVAIEAREAETGASFRGLLRHPLVSGVFA